MLNKIFFRSDTLRQMNGWIKQWLEAVVSRKERNVNAVQK